MSLIILFIIILQKTQGAKLSILDGEGRIQELSRIYKCARPPPSIRMGATYDIHTLWELDTTCNQVS